MTESQFDMVTPFLVIQAPTSRIVTLSLTAE